MPYITLSSKEYSRLPELCPRPISRPIVSPDTSRFLQAVKIRVDDEFHFEAWDEERKSELGTLTACFADFLVEKFSFPCK